MSRRIKASPDIPIAYTECFDNLKQPIPEGLNLKIKFTYPLEKPVVLETKAPAGMILMDVVDIVLEKYGQIYKETPENIWGHNIEDLYLEIIEVDLDTGDVKLGIGS